MGQREFLRALDDEIFDALEDEGPADIGAYTPPAAAPTTSAGARRCYVNNAGQAISNDGRVRAPRDVIAVLLADGAVEKGGSIAIGSETYLLREIDDTDGNDGSLQYWVVRRG